MPARVVITGAAGRMGRVLAAALADQGWNLRLLDLLPADQLPSGTIPVGAEYHVCDITDPASLAGLFAGADSIVHLAGHPNSSDWSLVERLNMGGTRAVLDAGRQAGVSRFIIASSIHAVGLYPADTAFTDDLPARPDGPYGLSKAHGEMLLRYFCDAWPVQGFGLRICSFRPAPGSARELRTWISPADWVRLATACLTTDSPGYHMVWGLSDNSGASIDRGMWRRIGYVPQDDGQSHEPSLRAAGIHTGLISEYPFLGGSFVHSATGMARIDRA